MAVCWLQPTCERNATRWLISPNGFVFGPFCREHVSAFIEEKKIARETWSWSDDENDLGDICEFCGGAGKREKTTGGSGDCEVDEVVACGLCDGTGYVGGGKCPTSR